MSAVLDPLGIDWSGPPRQACPLCAKPRCKAVSVTKRPEGGLAHCHRCGSSWFEKENTARTTTGAVLFDIERERQRQVARLAAAAQAERTEAERQAGAARQARDLWAAAAEVLDHPYLTTKRCLGHGTRVDTEGRLLVPMYVAGDLVNLQRIDGDGQKRFLAGGRTRGAVCVLRDCSIDVGAVFVAEGFATAATVHQATGLPVVVAFSAGNLTAAAAAARRMYPDDAIVIAADNDAKGERNAGLEAARAAAQELCCSLTWPSEPGDWNDARVAGGWGAVVAPLNKAAAMAREAVCRT